MLRSRVLPRQWLIQAVACPIPTCSRPGFCRGGGWAGDHATASSASSSSSSGTWESTNRAAPLDRRPGGGGAGNSTSAPSGSGGALAIHLARAREERGLAVTVDRHARPTLVDQAVVPAAEQDRVGQAGLAAIGPVPDMVRLGEAAGASGGLRGAS